MRVKYIRPRIMGYIYEDKPISEVRRILVGATCDNCEVTLEPVWTNEAGDVAGIFNGSLRVSVSGGYAEYIDGGGQVVLCSACAKKLEELPILRKAFAEARY